MSRVRRHTAFGFRRSRVAYPPSLGPRYRRGFSTTARRAQDAFHRFGARPCGRVRRLRVSRIRSHALAPHPFARPDQAPLVKGMSLRAVLLLAVAVCLAAHLDRASRRCSSHDFCNRHTTRAPVERSIPRREAFAVTDRDRAPLRPTQGWPSVPFRGAGAELPCGNAALSRRAHDGARRALAPPLTVLTHF